MVRTSTYHASDPASNLGGRTRRNLRTNPPEEPSPKQGHERSPGALYVVMKDRTGKMLNEDEAKEATLQLMDKGFRTEPGLLARMMKGFGRLDP